MWLTRPGMVDYRVTECRRGRPRSARASDPASPGPAAGRTPGSPGSGRRRTRTPSRRPKTLAQQSFEETARSLAVNLTSVVRICEHLLSNNPNARIAVVSSQSSRGSYDTTYFMAKVALDAYVEGRRLSAPGQQLVAVSPTIIMDSGMTQRRHDLDRVAERASRTPKGRLLRSDEVSRLLHYVLYVDEGTLTSTVVHLNCGEFAR